MKIMLCSLICSLWKEVKAAVFSMSSSSAPGPTSFGGHFYHTFWEIIGNDVFNSVLQFFYSELDSPWLKYRPIAMANF